MRRTVMLLAKLRDTLQSFFGTRDWIAVADEATTLYVLLGNGWRLDRVVKVFHR